MKKLFLIAIVTIFTFQFSISHAQCPEALMQYTRSYPQAEPQDLYKLVFQDLYGPGHLLTDSAAAVRYISKEVAEMDDHVYPDVLGEQGIYPFPLYEYTLCDSNFVRVNLVLVKRGIISVNELVSALMRSTQGMPTPDPKFVQTHSSKFKEYYDPHYRIVRRDIFEREFLARIPRRNSEKGPCMAYQNHTHFDDGELMTLLSLYRIESDFVCDTIKQGFCSFSGRVYVRDGVKEYSGELFDEFVGIFGHPHIVIPSLGIDTRIEDGTFKLTVPEGTYDVLIYANYYYPIQYKLEFKNKHYYFIDHYLGYRAIH